MAAKIDILKDTFQKEFDMERFVRFIKEFFNRVEVVRPDKKNQNFLSEFRFYVKAYTHIANYTDSEHNKVAIFAVEIEKGRSIERARSMQRNYISKLLTDNNFDAAIVAFYIEGEQRWRLSLVRLDLEFAKGKVKVSLPPAKRYSYLVGKGEPCHTAMGQLYPIFMSEDYNPTLDRIEEAFSVEAVTKEFFDKYREKYLQLKEELDRNESFREEAEAHKFTSEQFAKKLMGQIVFLYFLQKKGWLGVKVVPGRITEKEYKNAYFSSNKAAREIIPKMYAKTGIDEYKLRGSLLKDLSDSDADILAGSFKSEPWGSGTKTFLRDLFDNCINNSDRNYFEDYLEPLFYEALNRKRGEHNYYKRFNCKIPFLNGGLFEPINEYDWSHNKFSIPNELFSNKHIKGEHNADGILDIFDRYNFTMNEDEPLEREVAVDPEMLGKIFENLLDVKDRKSKGAFYTPREIVHYMCQESLINYLVNETGIAYEDMKEFIVYGELMKDEDYGKDIKSGSVEMRIPQNVYINLKKIDDALANVRVADPAVGSGAFPLGMLSEIARARNNITYYYAQMESDKFNRKVLFEVTRSPYKIKWDTIKNSIFAVDIEASAVDIAKLRLWLSLVVDQEVGTENDDLFFRNENKDPKPLPNLDCNIMCGNSLIDEFEGIKLIDESLFECESGSKGNGQIAWQISMFQDQINTMTEELFKEQDRLFDEEDNNKKIQIKKHIDEIIDSIIRAKLSKDNNQKGMEKYKESLQQKTKPYFLWELEFAKIFKEKGGFDIVIGNPPYFNVQTLGAKNKLVEYLKREYSDIWMDKSDILFYFIYKSSKISNSQVSFITSNAFLFSDKAKKLRNYLIDFMPLKKIVNFEKHMVFGSASITSCICFFDKLNKNKSTKTLVFKDKVENMTLELYDEKPMFNVTLTKDRVFALTPEYITKLNDKIDAHYPQLSTLVKVGKGMETGANHVFIFNTLPKFPDEYIKKRMSGEIINKYYISDPFEYLLYFEHVNSFEDLDKSIKRHLLNNREVLENRATVKNEGREWWRYSRPLHKEFYNLNKLWCSYRGKNNCFAYDDTKQFIGLTNTTVIFDTNPEINIKYLLALLNSTTLNYRYKSIGKQTGGGVFEYFENGIGKLPIPVISKSKQQPFVEMANKIIDMKKFDSLSDVTSYMKKIDEMVYELYGLTKDEIRIIEEA